MDSLTSGNPNPTNNPRMNLLNGSGTNTQINTTTANAYEASALHARPVPQPNPVNQTPLAVGVTDPKAAYVKAAAKKAAPEPPKPAPAPEPAKAQTPPPPEPRPVPSAPEPPRRRWPLIVGIIITVLVLIGAAIGWWLLSRSQPDEELAPTNAVEATNPTNLKQATGDGDSLAAGATANSKDLRLSFTVETDATSGALTPEVEVRKFGTAFTGEPTHTGSEVSASGSNLDLNVNVEGLENGQYHWQARVKTGDQTSEWVTFGDPANTTTPSFIVEASAAVSSASTTILSVGGVTAADPTNITTATPEFTGTSEPNATITVGVNGKSFKGTAGPSGSWSVSATEAIANGQHQVTVVATDASGATVGQTQLNLVVAVAAAQSTQPAPATTGSATASAPAAASPTASSSTTSTDSSTAAATQDQTLAATGDNAVTISLAGASILACSIVGLVWARRRYASIF